MFTFNSLCLHGLTIRKLVSYYACNLMLFFQLANYRRIYQHEYNATHTPCRVLAGIFSCLRNEQTICNLKCSWPTKNSIATTDDCTGGYQAE